MSVAGQLRSWCTSKTSREGVLEMVPMAVTLETVVLASVSEFGDLRSYAMLSQGCRAMQRQLAASMIVVRNHGRLYFVISPTPHGMCAWCSGYGDDLDAADPLAGHRCFPCDLCEEAVCEHCVCLATFDSSGVKPTSWICFDSHGETEPLCTVEPVRSWLFELADDRMLKVYQDYGFFFFFQIITLSGEVVRDEQKRPCSILISSWHSSFDRVWDAVYRCTGGRIRQMVFGDISIGKSDGFGFRWSHFLTRPGSRAYGRESPLQVTVLLRGWS